MFEAHYKEMLRTIQACGDVREGRNGFTRSIFGMHLDICSLIDGRFPILTGRKMYPKGVVGELRAFLKGPKTIKDFEDEGCNYWALWGDEEGSISVDYGNKWLDFNGVNQLEQLVDGLRKDPFSRRHIISAWDPGNLENLSLHCCHWAYQFNVTSSGFLDLIWIQRSVDMVIGLPSDIILAATLLQVIANTVHLKPGRIIMQLGDCHIYDCHDIQEYLNRRTYLEPEYTCTATLDDEIELTLHNYQHEEPIKYALVG